MISINCNSSKEVFKNPTIYFNALFNSLGNSTCSSPEVVLAFLLYEAALFIMRATNSSLVFTFSLKTSLFIHPHRQKSDLYAPTSNNCIFTPIKNWTHVYMNLFTRNSPYCHFLKYLLFLLKHPVYTVHSFLASSKKCEKRLLASTCLSARTEQLRSH